MSQFLLVPKTCFLLCFQSFRLGWISEGLRKFPIPPPCCPHSSPSCHLGAFLLQMCKFVNRSLPPPPNTPFHTPGGNTAAAKVHLCLSPPSSPGFYCLSYGKQSVRSFVRCSRRRDKKVWDLAIQYNPLKQLRGLCIQHSKNPRFGIKDMPISLLTPTPWKSEWCIIIHGTNVASDGGREREGGCRNKKCLLLLPFLSVFSRPSSRWGRRSGGGLSSTPYVISAQEIGREGGRYSPSAKQDFP